jgi:outer membrane protein OmpA-like peptidoglycan-associated protein
MKKTITAFLLFATSLAQAQDQSPTSASMQFTKEAVEVAPRGLIPFLGAGGGYTGYGGGENGSAEGTPGTLKILGSYYYESPWIAEFGYGFNSQYFIQSSAKDRTINNSAVELAARYRWESRWQAGIIADHLSNQGINYAANQADAQFVGLQFLKEFNASPAWLTRVGARAMGLTNNTGNNVYMYMIDFQIGWNPNAYKTSVKSTAATTTQLKQEKIAVEMQTPASNAPLAESTPLIRDINYSSIAGAGTIVFTSAKFTVNKKDRKHLAKVAKVLNENKDLLERVEVVGYADGTGKSSSNQTLSMARAEHVKNILVQSGLKDVPVETIGKGESEATGHAVRSERRAELVFIGVKNEEALKNALASIE